MRITLDGNRPFKHALKDVWSPQLGNRRDVDVYLPASYGRRRHHAVVYMHDGQNLSDQSRGFAGTWRLESALIDLAAAGIEPIIVGVHNDRDRLAEYSPFPDSTHGGGNGDAYLSFVIQTVKPRIDRLFRTSRRASQTAIVGSSMGGLISLYAWLRRPDLFALAGAMSPAVWYGRQRLMGFIASSKVRRGRLYLDVGTAEGRAMLKDVRAVNALLETRSGPTNSRITLVEDRGGRHDEVAWGRRLGGALKFLLE